MVKKVNASYIKKVCFKKGGSLNSNDMKIK